jgi:YVTN family beta-propeller protein
MECVDDHKKEGLLEPDAIAECVGDELKKSFATQGECESFVASNGFPSGATAGCQKYFQAKNPDAGAGGGDAGAVGSMGYAYVANTKDSPVTLSVIDVATLTEVKKLPTGTIDIGDCMPSDDGRFVFCGSSSSNVVIQVDTTTNTVVGSLPSGARPVHIYTSPPQARGQVWVMNDGSGDVTVLDKNAMWKEIFPGGIAPDPTRRPKAGNGHHKAAFTDATPYVTYVSNITDGTFTPIVGDASLRTLPSIAVGNAPHGMDYSKNSKAMYGCSGPNMQANPPLPAAIPIGPTEGSTRGAVNTDYKQLPVPVRCSYLRCLPPDGRYCIGTLKSMTQGAAAIIDTNNDTISATVPTGATPDNFDYTEDGKEVWVANAEAPTLTVIDMTAGAVKQTIMVGNQVTGAMEPRRRIRDLPGGKQFWTTNNADNTVSVVDATTYQVIKTIPVGQFPTTIAFAGAPGKITFYPR